jgi:hypothetical protein
MKNKFVADGYHRFMRTKKADPLQKLQIRKRMVQEYLRRGNEGHQPSAGTLW